MGRLSQVEKTNRYYKSISSLPLFSKVDFKRKLWSMYMWFYYLLPIHKNESVRNYLHIIKWIRYNISKSPVTFEDILYIEKVIN